MEARSWRRYFLGCAAALVVLAWSSAAMAQAKDPMYGTWKLNLAKSKYSPGPAPKEMTVTMEADGPGRKITVTGVAGDGTPIKWGYSGALDGKEIRITGDNPEADNLTAKRIAPNATRTVWKKANKRTLTNGVSVSADGKTLTVATTGNNAKGQVTKNTQVFDRQ